MLATIPPPSNTSAYTDGLISRTENVRYVDISSMCATEGMYLYVPNFAGSLTDSSVIDPIDEKLTNINSKAEERKFEKPAQKVIDTAKIIYGILDENGFKYFDLPLSEGGIGFEFTYKNNYYNIKIDNELDAVFYTEKEGELVHGWDLNFEQLIEKLKTEFNGV